MNNTPQRFCAPVWSGGLTRGEKFSPGGAAFRSPRPSSATVATETDLPQPKPLTVLAEWSGTAGPVYSKDWAPDGRTIATTGREHVPLLDGETCEELATLEGFEGFV